MVQQQSNIQQPNFLGQQVGGYQLIELLGQGGFAQVYKGEHVASKRVAAIKVFIASVNNQIVIPNDQIKARLMQEAIIHSQLVHPHIIKMFGSGTQYGLPGFPQGVPFLVLEYAPHGDLFKAYKGRLPLAPLVVINLVNQVADGLQYAHDRDVIHRDLKPLNLLFNAQNQVLLADFGLAQVLAQDESYYVTQGAVRGTLSYMSPEHFLRKTNKASDQYSLGVIAYEWLSGEKLFEGDQAQLMAQHLYTPPTPLRQVAPSVSPEVEKVVLQALEKASGNRFPSVKDFARALEAAAQPKAARSAAQPKAAPAAPAQPGTASSATQPDTTPPAAQPQASPLDSLQWTPNPLPAPPYPYILPPLSPPASTQLNPIVLPGTAIANFPLQAQTKAIYWLPNSPLLAATSVDNQIYIWDTSGSGKDTTYRHKEGKWSPDYRYMAYPVTDGVEVYDVVQQRPVYTYHGQTEIIAIAWSPDGYSIASVGKAASGQSFHIWYALTGQLQRSSRPYTGPRRKVSLLAWSPDGRSLACTDQSAAVTIWSANELIISCALAPEPSFAHEVPAELCWSATGRYLAIGLSGQVRVWDVWKTIDEAYQQISQGSGQPRGALAHRTQGAVADVKDYLTYGQDSQLIRWRPFNAGFQQNSSKRTESSFLALLSDSSSIEVWDVSTGDRVSRCTSDTLIHSLTWSPDGKALAAGGEQGMIEIWDPWTGKKLQQAQHGESHEDYQIHALAWSPDGQYLASGGGMLAGGDHYICLWQEQGLTNSVSLDLPSQSVFIKFIKNLDVSSWLALLLGLLDLVAPVLIGIITTSLLAFFVAPFFALVAVALATKSVIDISHAASSEDTLAFTGILTLFSIIWAITFFAIGDSVSGGATGGFIIGGIGAVVGWFLHRRFLKALYRGKSHSDMNTPQTWGGEWGSRG